MKKSRVRLYLLLLLSTFLSVLVLLPFHICMRLSGSLLSLPFFDTQNGTGLLVVLVVVLSALQIGLLSGVRIRNCSVNVLSYFMERGVRFRFVLALFFAFVTCSLSFLMGLALGGEAPSVFMGAIIFAGVFSLAKEDQKRLLRAIKVGSCVGFSLAFMNPLAGILYSFVPNKFEKGYLKKEWKLILEGCLCAVFGFFLYGALKGLIYFDTYQGAFWKAYLFNEFQISVLALPIASLRHYWIFLLIAVLAALLGYLYVHGLGFFRKLLWKEKRSTYVISAFGAVLLIPLLHRFFPLSLGTGASIIESSEELLNASLASVAALLGVRLLFTFFSLTSHFSGGCLIPTLAIGSLLGTTFSLLLKMAIPLSEGECLLIVYSFTLSFFAVVTNKRSGVLALTLSFGPSPALLLSIVPSLLLEWLLGTKLKGFSSLAQAFAKSDIQNSSYAQTLWCHYPYCSPMFEDIWEERNISRRP